MVFLGIMLFLGGMFAAGGPVNGKKFELGTAVSFWLTSDEGESYGYLNIPIRFGWFAWKGFELEPEVILTFPLGDLGGDTSYLLLGHVTYNFQTSGKLVPFIGGGAGFGNGVPIFGIVEGNSDVSTFAFDGLAGIKFLLSDFAAIRAEYRISRFSMKYSGFEERYKETIHQAFVGLSVFF
jgi:opacity protein-like surface antigen